MAEYDEVGGCHRVVYDDGEEAWENLCGDGRVNWKQSAARELQADSEADSEAEAEVEVETEADVAPLKTAPQPQPKRPASPVNLPSEPSQRRQRGGTSEPHAAAQSAFCAGSRGPLRYTADLVEYLPLLVRCPACPPLLCTRTLQHCFAAPSTSPLLPASRRSARRPASCWGAAGSTGMTTSPSYSAYETRHPSWCAAAAGSAPAQVASSHFSSPLWLASQVYSKYETTDRPGKEARSGAGRASVSDLGPRLAMAWSGQEVVAAAVYRHSHEEHPPSKGTAPPIRKRRSGKPRQTEILLFGVSDRCRRKGLGTALFEYVKHLAIVHARISWCYTPSRHRRERPPSGA